MPGDESEVLLAKFWELYKGEQDSHAVYGKPSRRLKNTIPLYLHGDGGRTAKKQPLEVISFEPVLGLDTALKTSSTCKCREPMQVGSANLCDPEAQRLNCKHNSSLTRFLLCAYPSKKYPKFKGLLIAMHKVISDNLGEVCHHGFFVNGRRWYVACLGYKGDMEYHTKFGELSRSYQNVGHKYEHACCHECDAGSPGTPFEDISVTALWTRTCCSVFPWRSTPPFAAIPFEDWRSPPSRAPLFYRRDPFHIFRHGAWGLHFETWAFSYERVQKGVRRL